MDKGQVPRKKIDRTPKGGICQLCGLWNSQLERHEITRGIARSLAVDDPDLQLLVCNGCHQLVEDYSKWSPKRQLRWRLQIIVDKFNINLGKAPTHCTLIELGAMNP